METAVEIKSEKEIAEDIRRTIKTLNDLMSEGKRKGLIITLVITNGDYTRAPIIERLEIIKKL